MDIRSINFEKCLLFRISRMMHMDLMQMIAALQVIDA